jgi:quercetin dioxygenase-like cupin family protein
MRNDDADALDAVLAAPRHHRVLLENAAVRVLETVIAPGERVDLHTHRWPAVYYFLETGEFVRRNARGDIEADSRTLAASPRAGDAAWAPPLGPHTLENVGSTSIRVVSVELKHGMPSP